METESWIWLIVTILAAVVEAAVPSLVSVWFVPGGLAACAASVLGAELWLQIVLFLAVSCLALVVTRPLAKKLLSKDKQRTNVDMIIGKHAIVTDPIDNIRAEGRVSVMGNSWSARSAGGEPINVGETVVVERIEGVKLIVTQTEEGE